MIPLSLHKILCIWLLFIVKPNDSFLNLDVCDIMDPLKDIATGVNNVVNEVHSITIKLGTKIEDLIDDVLESVDEVVNDVGSKQVDLLKKDFESLALSLGKGTSIIVGVAFNIFLKKLVNSNILPQSWVDKFADVVILVDQVKDFVLNYPFDGRRRRTMMETEYPAYKQISSQTLTRVMSPRSPPLDNHIATAWCPSELPTLISCGVISGNKNIDGTKVNEFKACDAQNGQGNTNGVVAVAHCTDNKYTCTYPQGELSGHWNDAISQVQCTDNQVMISCSSWEGWSNIDGAHVGDVGDQYKDTIINFDTKCTAYNNGASYGTRAEGICCEYTGYGYHLDCKTKWSSPATMNHASVTCDTGYTMMGCSGYTAFNVLGGWWVEGANCIALSVGAAPVQAVATCCRLAQDPTPKPTKSPTQKPTQNPTKSPTQKPTQNPTKSPTRKPSQNPTKSPTQKPTQNPTKS
eukprot:402493_1